MWCAKIFKLQLSKKISLLSKKIYKKKKKQQKFHQDCSENIFFHVTKHSSVKMREYKLLDKMFGTFVSSDEFIYINFQKC